jgi:hypothetical protein
MDIIRRKILLEDLISRNADETYGLITATTIEMKIMLSQTIDNMGIYTDYPYIPEDGSSADYTVLLDKLNSNNLLFPFMTGATEMAPLTGTSKDTRLDGSVVSDFYKISGEVTGFTDTKVEAVRSYNKTTPFIIGFDVNTQQYVNFNNVNIDGRSRITSLNSDIVSGTTGYTIDTNLDPNIGTPNQTSGILYSDSVTIRSVLNDTTAGLGLNVEENTLKETTIQYIGEGWNETNTSLSALTKEEYLLGIIAPPEVQSDVFIDRGKNSVFDLHLRLSEIESLKHLEMYGNGFYNIKKQ